MSDDSTSREPSVTEALFDSRLVMVTGKGGTGKTTFAAALASVAAGRGKHTLLCELDAQRPSLASVFREELSFEPVEVRPGLDVANITWNEALKSFLTTLVPSRRVVRLLLTNNIVARFLDFTPGSREIVILSAMAQHVEAYDMVVIDMPASGHAFSLLDIPRSAIGLFRSGPVRRRAGELEELIRRRDTAIVFVALPEEMVVNETLETIDRMRVYGILEGSPTVFLNRATLPSLTDVERELIQRLSDADLDPAQREFVLAGRWEDALEQATARAQQRLADELDNEAILVAPAPPGVDAVESVAVTIGRLMGMSRRDLAWT